MFEMKSDKESIRSSLHTVASVMAVNLEKKSEEHQIEFDQEKKDTSLPAGREKMLFFNLKKCYSKLFPDSLPACSSICGRTIGSCGAQTSRWSVGVIQSSRREKQPTLFTVRLSRFGAH